MIFDIPHDILSHIFNFLETNEQTLLFMYSCKRAYSLAKKEGHARSLEWTDDRNFLTNVLKYMEYNKPVRKMIVSTNSYDTFYWLNHIKIPTKLRLLRIHIPANTRMWPHTVCSNIEYLYIESYEKIFTNDNLLIINWENLPNLKYFSTNIPICTEYIDKCTELENIYLQNTNILNQSICNLSKLHTLVSDGSIYLGKSSEKCIHFVSKNLTVLLIKKNYSTHHTDSISDSRYIFSCLSINLPKRHLLGCDSMINPLSYDNVVY